MRMRATGLSLLIVVFLFSMGWASARTDLGGVGQSDIMDTIEDDPLDEPDTGPVDLDPWNVEDPGVKIPQGPTLHMLQSLLSLVEDESANVPSLLEEIPTFVSVDVTPPPSPPLEAPAAPSRTPDLPRPPARERPDAPGPDGNAGTWASPHSAMREGTKTSPGPDPAAPRSVPDHPIVRLADPRVPTVAPHPALSGDAGPEFNGDGASGSVTLATSGPQFPVASWPGAAAFAFRLFLTATLLLLAPYLILYRRIERRRLLESSHRREALHYVQANPGTTAAAVADHLSVYYNAARHHLDLLVEFSFLRRRVMGSNVRYFQNHGRYTPEEERALSVAARDENARVLALVGRLPGVPKRELAARLDLATSTAYRRAAILEAAGLLAAEGGRLRLTPEGARALLKAPMPPPALVAEPA